MSGGGRPKKRKPGDVSGPTPKRVFTNEADRLASETAIAEANERELHEIELEQNIDNDDVIFADDEPPLDRNYLLPPSIFI